MLVLLGTIGGLFLLTIGCMCFFGHRDRLEKQELDDQQQKNWDAYYILSGDEIF